MANVTELRVALTVTDFGQALAFYRDTLGLEQVADWSSASGRVVVLDAGRSVPCAGPHAAGPKVTKCRLNVLWAEPALAPAGNGGG